MTLFQYVLLQKFYFIYLFYIIIIFIFSEVKFRNELTRLLRIQINFSDTLINLKGLYIVFYEHNHRLANRNPWGKIYLA